MITKYFASFADFVTAAEGPAFAGVSRRSRIARERGWGGTETWEEAIDLARNGWADGRAIVEKFRAVISERIQSSIGVQQICDWQLAGSEVDVGRFVTGEPECMIEFHEVAAERPSAKFAKVVFNMTTSAGVSPEQMQIKGAATVALIDTLESQGVRVEVLLVTETQVDKTETGRGLRIQAQVKATEEPVEIDRLAFALANPATFRRLGFAIHETINPSEEVGPDDCYGPVSNVPESMRGDIYVGASQLWNESSAAAWILAQLKSLGIEVAAVA